MDAGCGRPADERHFVGDKLDWRPGIAADAGANFDLDGQLFAEFAGKALLVGLARLCFAAWKFPEPRTAVL
jgi:hypothetical protein